MTTNWLINFRLGARIHPEDAARAIEARLRQSCNRRSRISEKTIIEDLLIASLVNNPGWSEGQTKQVQEHSVDTNFCERLARAFATKKPPTWDEIDIFILENWRELHVKPAIEKKYGKLPGLRDWSPRAIAGLFSYAGVLNSNYSGNFEDWFTTRRKRLGLPGKHRYEIKDAFVIDDTLRIIGRSGTRKSFLCPGK